MEQRRRPRLTPEARAALRAWADLDQFEVPEVPTSTEEGWAAVGVIDRRRPPAPWPPKPEKAPSRGGHRRQLVTRVMVGCVPVAQVEADLERLFADDVRFAQGGVQPGRQRRGSGSGPLTCRASFLLDATGRPVLGSFAYSPLIDVTRHVRHHLESGAPRAEALRTSLEAIDERRVSHHDGWQSVAEGPADRDPAQLVLELLKAVSVQGGAHRYVTQWVAADQQPPGQLPSFFRDDLLAAADSDGSPLLATYLAGRPGGRPAPTRDVDERGVLAEAVRPSRTPRAAWPSGHLPRLSQQVALAELRSDGTGPLVAVNGPPGTGKTTLLRDVYANLVTDRASVMASFDDPRRAFGSERAVPAGPSRTVKLHPPDPALCGFEMLVASSNNAAVENVSRELPALEGIASGARERTAYFQSATQAASTAAGERPALLPDGRAAWGMAAAALGSRARIAEFCDVVGRYLSGAGRTGLLQELADGASTAEWSAARRRFSDAQDVVEQHLARLVSAEEAIASLPDLERGSRDAGAAAEATRTELARCSAARARAQVAADGRELPAATAEAAHTRLLAQRPATLSRWLRTARASAWESHEAEARRLRDSTALDLAAHRDVLDDHCRREAAADAVAQVAQAQRRAADERLGQARDAAASCAVPLDATWWERPPADRERGPVWVDDALQEARGELFAAAMHVHEVFARRAGAQVASNLRTWMALQSGEVERAAAREVALPAWQAFFLVVPLASTTFASLARLLDQVPPDSLGWLVVDEAGQAVPGAAVGGMTRFQHALVVGDPLQLEPVVALPAALVTEVVRHHGAPEDLAPDRASVQLLGDAVSTCGTGRRGAWVGLPLRAHNRCLDPMFSIANAIAYDGDMVHSRRPLTPRERDELTAWGESRWVDVPRSDGAHLHALDTREVLRVLARIDWSREQSVSVISPFRDVVRGLRDPVRDVVLARLPDTVRDDPEGRERALQHVRVGTVHTFQGRESTAVLLVLGGGSSGARSWAAGSPNLLNVAVTRAKDRLIVIGDRERWRVAGCARTLHELLPPSQPTGDLGSAQRPPCVGTGEGPTAAPHREG